MSRAISSGPTDDGKDIALQGRSGIDNLARALYLDNPDTEGWDMLATFAADATADPRRSARA